MDDSILGRRLPEQRSVVQATGAVGPGGEVLHFGASSLSPSHSAASRHRFPRPHGARMAEAPGGPHARELRPLRPSAAVLLLIPSGLHLAPVPRGCSVFFPGARPGPAQPARPRPQAGPRRPPAARTLGSPGRPAVGVRGPGSGTPRDARGRTEPAPR